MTTTTMAMMEPLVAEYVQEAANTRRMLERVPEKEFGWKPHEKSWTLGELASHIAHAQIWAPMTVNNDKLEMKSGEFKPYIATSLQDLLDTFDENVEQARQAMAVSATVAPPRCGRCGWTATRSLRCRKLRCSGRSSSTT